MSQSRPLVTSTQVSTSSSFFQQRKPAPIKTQDLTLKPLNLSNQTELVNHYYGLLSQPCNTARFRDGKPWTKEKVEEYINVQTKRWETGSTFGVYSVHLTASDTYIGSLNNYYIEDDYKDIGKGHTNVVEIGYFVDSKHWGKRYGTQMVQAAIQNIESLIDEATAVIESGEKKPVPTEIVATVHPENNRSVSILEKGLKNKEADIFLKSSFDGKPRTLFYYPLKPKTTTEPVTHVGVEAKNDSREKTGMRLTGS